MKRLTLDDLSGSLPDLDELRPILDELLSLSQPDPSRVWSGSGQLGTAGVRLVAEGTAARAVETAGDREAEHLRAAYGKVREALEALERGDGSGAARAYLEAAAAEEERERPDKASAYAEAAHRAVESHPDRALAALALRRWARYMRSTGELARAAQLYERAHDLARDAGDGRGAAEAAIGAGNVMEDQGRWDEAERWYRGALEALGRGTEPMQERWQALINLHIVARWQGALDESEALLEQAEEAARMIDPEAAAPFIQNARGQLLMARGDATEAEAHFRSALLAAQGTRARVIIRLNLAECLLALGRTLDAASHAREAERDAVQARLWVKLPETYRLLGRIATEEGNPDAFVFFERALELVRGRDLPALEEALTLQAYAEAEGRGGDPETAGELRSAARERFAALGFTQERQPWADVLGPASNMDPPEGDEHHEDS